MQIVCENCKNTFKPKLLPLTFRDRAQCTHCNHMIYFNNISRIKTFNTIFAIDLTIVTVCFSVWLVQTYDTSRLLVATGVVFVILFVFVPIHNAVVCHYYKKFGGQEPGGK